MLTKENLNETLADAVMDRPREFRIDDRRFLLWSPTLGMSLMLSRHLSGLEINRALMAKDPTMEILRLATTNKEKCCHILAIHTFRRCRHLTNSELIKQRAGFFRDHLENKELAQLLHMIFMEPDADSLITLSGLREQQEKQAQIAKVKREKNRTMTFGGLTMYGALIAPAMSALNMTMHQVVWEISLTNLKMLLADTVSTVYLSEEEVKAINAEASKEKYGMTPEDIAKLKAMDWD